jgi:ketosteroid isomerase-like protein
MTVMDSVRRFTLLLLAAVLTLSSMAAPAADDENAANRKQLLAIMTEIEAAINAQSAERIVALMADNVTVTWLNAEVSRGKDEVRAYHARMVGGQGAILKKYVTQAKLGASARFYGDVAVAEGTAADEFYPHARDVFRLDSRWSSTLVRLNGEWKISTLHLSSNVFSNPLVAELERTIWIAAIGGAVGGLILGGLFAWWRRRANQNAVG